MTEAEGRAAVLAETKTWLGTPYHHRAWVKGGGVDCGYLPICIFSNVGLMDFFHPAHYPMDFAIHNNTEWYKETVLRFTAQVDEPQPGDLALFFVGRVFSHSGMVMNWPRIIHASSTDRGPKYPLGVVCYGDASKDHRLLRQKGGAARPVEFYSYWAKDRAE